MYIEEKTLTVLDGLALGGLIITAITLQPHVIVNMWRWFIVPLGVPVIGHWHAFALLMLLGYFRVKNWNEKSAPGLGFYNLIGNTFGLLVMWVIGYLIAS